MVKNSVVRFFGTACTKGIFYISWHANVLTNDSDAILPLYFPNSAHTLKRTIYQMIDAKLLVR